MRTTFLKFWLVFVILTIVLTNVSSAESVKLNKNYFKGYISDTKSIFTSPLRWEKSDWVKASLIAGITGGLYAFDQEIQDWMQGNRSNTSNNISKFAKPFGNGRYTLPSLGAFYLYGHLNKDKTAQRVSLLSLESFMISGIFTQIIKFSGHRYRPNSEAGQNKWDGPGFSTSNLSFPSGHSSSAFAIGTIIASEYKESMFIPPLAYGIATLTAFSRVNDNFHWASDAFLGSAIGYFTAKAILALHKNDRTNRLSFIAILNSKQSSILISYKF